MIKPTIYIKADEEYGPENWWQAARELGGEGTNPTFCRIMRAIDPCSGGDAVDGVNVNEDEAKIFLEVASALPGWHDGPEHAPHPIQWGDDDSEWEDDDDVTDSV